MFGLKSRRSRAEAKTREQVEEAKRELGERAVDATRRYFPNEYEARQRDSLLKAAGASFLLGVLATVSVTAARRTKRHSSDD